MQSHGDFPCGFACCALFTAGAAGTGKGGVILKINKRLTALLCALMVTMTSFPVLSFAAENLSDEAAVTSDENMAEENTAEQDMPAGELCSTDIPGMTINLRYGENVFPEGVEMHVSEKTETKLFEEAETAVQDFCEKDPEYYDWEISEISLLSFEFEDTDGETLISGPDDQIDITVQLEEQPEEETGYGFFQKNQSGKYFCLSDPMFLRAENDGFSITSFSPEIIVMAAVTKKEDPVQEEAEELESELVDDIAEEKSAEDNSEEVEEVIEEESMTTAEPEKGPENENTSGAEADLEKGLENEDTPDEKDSVEEDRAEEKNGEDTASEDQPAAEEKDEESRKSSASVDEAVQDTEKKAGTKAVQGELDDSQRLWDVYIPIKMNTDTTGKKGSTETEEEGDDEEQVVDPKQYEGPAANFTLHAWVSDSKMGDTPDYYYTDGFYYLCYEIYETSSKVNINDYGDYSYSVKETITAPSGSTAHEYTYTKSGDNWIGHRCSEAGTYTGTVTVSGDLGITVNVSWNVLKDMGTRLHVWIGDSSGNMYSEYTQGITGYLWYEITDQETGKRINEFGSYPIQVVETIIKPDGTKATATYSNDCNWVRTVCDQLGHYRGVVELTGKWSNTMEVAWDVVKSVSECSSSLSTSTYVYYGQEKRPNVYIYNGSTTLVKNVDYTLSYYNNVNAGTARVVITGKGNYTGTKTLYYSILRIDPVLNRRRFQQIFLYKA